MSKTMEIANDSNKDDDVLCIFKNTEILSNVIL